VPKWNHCGNALSPNTIIRGRRTSLTRVLDKGRGKVVACLNYYNTSNLGSAVPMPRKRAVTLTNHELRLMNILWDRRSATVADIVAFLEPPPLAYTTVLTTLSTMEEKGYVVHDKAGRAFVYRPSVQRSDAATSLLDTLLERFFGSSPGNLALSLLEDERLSAKDIESLKRVIERKRKSR